MTAARDLVSVITRTRDRPELLAEALDSVASQDYPAIEHIVVNDGGQDVRALVERSRSHVRVRYLEPGLVGRCRAGNIGLEAAKGRWIAWLDDDDLYYPHHVSTLVKALEHCGKLVVYSDADHVVQSWDPENRVYREVSKKASPSFEWSKITLWRRGDLHLVTIMHDRECTDRLGGFDEGILVLEDLELLSRFAQDYNFFHVPETTASFRVRDDQTNAVTSLRKDFVQARALLYKRYAHIVLPEVLTMVEFGAIELAELRQRVANLEEELRKIRGGGSG